MDRHIARTIVRNSAGDARVIWSIFSGYHPQELRESGAAVLYPVCISIFFPVVHELWWPKRVCAAKQDMIFGVLCHKVLIYDFHQEIFICSKLQSSLSRLEKGVFLDR